jgi:hypothetical protein
MNFNITKDSHIQQPNIYTSEVFVHKSSDGLTTYSLSHLFVQFLLLISHTHRWTHSISLFQPLGDDNRLEPRQSAATEISDNKHQQQHQHGIPSSYRLNRAILFAEKRQSASCLPRRYATSAGRLAPLRRPQKLRLDATVFLVQNIHHFQKIYITCWRLIFCSMGCKS